MESLNLEIINPSPVLTDLRSKIQDIDLSETVYLSRTNRSNLGEGAVSVLDMSTFGIHEYALPEVLYMMGIRSMTLDKPFDLETLSKFDLDLTQISSERYLWHYLRNDSIIAELRILFENCRTIAFDNWSAVIGASDVWSGLLTDVIRPIKRKDFEFIFYLGNPEVKLSFQVDEAIDIISDFSIYGQVTFALDEHEAVKLWKILNGVDPETEIVNDLNRKYISIFRSINVARLMIYSAEKVVLFGEQKQFVLTRTKVDKSVEMASDARENFIAGFSLGLMLKLDIARCQAFGLVVFGSFGEKKVLLSKSDLVDYINSWIEDLQKPEAMYLYQ